MKKNKYSKNQRGLPSTTFNQIKSGAGFTLIEVLMYIGFFTLLVGTLLGVAYQTIASTEQINKKIVLQQESDFISRKIDWALTGASAVSTGPLPSDISITRYSVPTLVVFSQNGNFTEINSGMGRMDLNSANTIVSNLVFTKTSNPPQPDKIQADFDINCLNCAAGLLRHFQIVKYFRK
jgi:hypothetical protein